MVIAVRSYAGDKGVSRIAETFNEDCLISLLFGCSELFAKLILT